jgi:5-enolpyruvylshikimate-3-phosphate synthase
MASIQGDVRFADALNRMGANVMAGDNWIEVRGTSVTTADSTASSSTAITFLMRR